MIAGDPQTALIVEQSDGTLRSYDWTELGELVEITCRYLLKKIPQQPAIELTKIGYLSDNSITDILLSLACMKLGFTEFPFDHRLPEHEIQARWSTVQGLWVVGDELLSTLADTSNWKQLPSIADFAPTNPDTTALVLWTSGTTGQPRGVELSHASLLGNAWSKLKAVPQNRTDVRLSILPLCHAYARTCDLGTWLISGCTLATSLGYRGLERLAPMVRPTLINVVPSIAKRILEDQQLAGLDRLRLLGCGGAGLPIEAFKCWSEDRGVIVIQGYGLTETAPVICSATPNQSHPGLVGHFVDGWEHKVERQQLFVRGPNMMQGYWNDSTATANKIDANGWLATGDQVEFDAKTGQLRVLGRCDDVIVLDTGKKLHPQLIERSVNEIEGIERSMLTMRSKLELWIDLNPQAAQSSHESNRIDKELKNLMLAIPDLGNCEVQRFKSSLMAESGELTTKGTLRRTQIIANRFSV